MQTPIDVLARRQQEMAEQAAANERARVTNVNRFVEMYLTLGPDATRLDGNLHDSELAEAKALAADRWFELLDMEQQVIRDEQKLAARSKKRPAQPGDELLRDRTLAQRDAGWLDETKYKQGALVDLKPKRSANARNLSRSSRKRGEVHG
jgi:hypothetical protein